MTDIVDMTDIVERLIAWDCDSQFPIAQGELMILRAECLRVKQQDAEIERLQAEVDELEERLDHAREIIAGEDI